MRSLVLALALGASALGVTATPTQASAAHPCAVRPVHYRAGHYRWHARGYYRRFAPVRYGPWCRPYTGCVPCR